MSVHSPGPWKWKENLEKGRASEQLAVLLDATGNDVCNFGVDAGYDSGEGLEPKEADARLIASAPELLAMLERVLADFYADEPFTRYACEERHGEGSYKRSPVIAEAEALVRRVKGEP